MGTPPGEILKTRESAGPSADSPHDARVFTDDEDHSVVQERMALLYKVLVMVTTSFYLVGAMTMAVFERAIFWPVHRSSSKMAHLVMCAIAIGCWRLCKRKALLSRTVLSLIDLSGLALLMTCAAVMIALAGGWGLHAEFLVLPVIVLVGAMRAALVPSPPRWTTIVTAVAALPVLPGIYFATAQAPLAVGGLGAVSGVPFVMALGFGWSAAAIAVANLISRVIYGLRTQVKKAMQLGQYTLEQKLGEGGMGIVYRARHALLRRPTAIKLLPSDRTSAHDIRRFEREVQLTSMLTHPNTVAIYDFGHTQEGVFYYAMEHLDGLSLHDLVENDGPQTSARVIHILIQIASALSEAHTIGLVHRDVKPANIFLCERGGMPDFVKVLDFGLVKQTGSSDPALSHTGAIAGTPHYMAPESILEPATVDGRVDLYALGAVGYFLLTGVPVFEGANLVEICSHHIHTSPEPPSGRAPHPVVPGLERVILACLAKSRDDRPASAAVVVELLRACQLQAAWDEAAARAWWAKQRASIRPNYAAENAATETADGAGAKRPARAKALGNAER